MYLRRTINKVYFIIDKIYRAMFFESQNFELVKKPNSASNRCAHKFRTENADSYLKSIAKKFWKPSKIFLVYKFFYKSHLQNVFYCFIKISLAKYEQWKDRSITNVTLKDFTRKKMVMLDASTLEKGLFISSCTILKDFFLASGTEKMMMQLFVSSKKLRFSFRFNSWLPFAHRNN